jgi:hypothetical protein
LERIEKEELEEEKRLNAEYIRRKMENIQRGGDDNSTVNGDVSGVGGGGHEDISNGTEEEEEEKSDGSGGVGRSYDLESGRGGVQGDKTWFDYFNARS